MIIKRSRYVYKRVGMPIVYCIVSSIEYDDNNEI